MSRDNWSRLVEATLKREKDRQLAFCQSFSSCSSIDDWSSRFSLDSTDFEDYRISSETIIPEASSGQSIQSRHVYTIKFQEIKWATKNFHPDLFLGDGRFGPVYKGWIHEYNMTAAKPGSGLTVAIMKWKLEGFEVMMEWLIKIKFLMSKTQLEVHPNVVRLIAHSYGEGDLFLVYQFTPNVNNIVSMQTSEAYRISTETIIPETSPGQSRIPSRRVYTIEFEKIQKATMNFHPELILRDERSGPVYKGWIHEPGYGLTVVAIKKLKLEDFSDLENWLNQIKVLSKLQHPNLVNLIAHCSEEDQRVLVYEFMPNGSSLDSHLFKKGYHESLSWATRMKVATGASRALSFLQYSKGIQVIYRIFKPENILLDGEYNAKLNGFSLAIDDPIGDMTHVSAQVIGTYVHAAPEYVATGHLTAKGDVYGFGVVLLELLTGRRALDKSRAPLEQNLVDWAQPSLLQKRRLKKIMDPKLEGQYPAKGAYIFASLASKCLSSDPRNRPTMAEVLVALEQL